MVGPLTESAASPEALVDNGVRWLNEHIAWFDPQRWERFLPRRKVRFSPLLELMILTRCLRRGPFPEQAEELTRQAYPLGVSICKDARFAEQICRAGTVFAYQAHLVALLAETGADELDGIRTRIQSVLDTDTGELFAPDRPALSRLELRYVLDIGGFGTVERPAIGFYRESVLATREGPLSFSDDEVYALTHVLFYLTDFGAHPVLEVDTGEQERVRGLVLVLLGACLARGDHDLAGELLLCAETLDAHHHELVRHGWHTIADHQRADGAVPSPVHDPAVLAQLQGDKREAYLFGTCFHTTMVAVMAASERVRRG